MGDYLYSSDYNRAEGIGAQLLGEMINSAVSIPTLGWTYTQNLLTGAIAIQYRSNTTELTQVQRSAITAAISGHIPVVKEFRAVDLDPPTQRAIETIAWAWRNWAIASASAKDLLLKTLLLFKLVQWDKPI